MRALPLILALSLLAACGDREQVAQSQRTYQGKPDTPAWGTGERVTWEAAIKARQLTQNEYPRVGR
jgi:hypothetical protein